MRFLRKNKIEKTILVISDIHLGAGAIVNGRRNPLEDFHYDEELVEFLSYYSNNEYANREVELIINGDLFDLLAVPFIKYFDDEYWSEKASLEKLKMIIDAHPEVMSAFSDFIGTKKKKITYIIGNHDGELAHTSLREYLINFFDEDRKERFNIETDPSGDYIPTPGVLLQHGHEYEVAHQFHLEESIISDEEGNKYFNPPWGSYYVTRVINKFKEERGHINGVKPIKKAMINGMIYDPLFTLRFLLANAFYFIMVRFISFYKQGRSIREVIGKSLSELELFHDLEHLCRDIFQKRKGIGCLIVGHTHEPTLRTFADGNIFINTGTWTEMHFLDWDRNRPAPQLTYAQIDIHQDRHLLEVDTDAVGDDLLKGLDLSLNTWKGVNTLPFQEF